MRCVIQYVDQASVSVGGSELGQIDQGLVVLVAFFPTDDESVLTKIAKQIVSLRTIPDDHQKLNRSLTDVQGALLLIPQFTLYANLSKGHRPYFGQAAPPEQAKQLFAQFVELCKQLVRQVEVGEFGAHMVVSLKNDGPITIILDSDHQV